MWRGVSGSPAVSARIRARPAPMVSMSASDGPKAYRQGPSCRFWSEGGMAHVGPGVRRRARSFIAMSNDLVDVEVMVDVRVLDRREALLARAAATITSVGFQLV